MALLTVSIHSNRTVTKTPYKTYFPLLEKMAFQYILTLEISRKNMEPGMVWSYISVSPTLGKPRENDHEFKVSLSYIVRCYHIMKIILKDERNIGFYVFIPYSSFKLGRTDVQFR